MQRVAVTTVLYLGETKCRLQYECKSFILKYCINQNNVTFPVTIYDYFIVIIINKVGTVQTPCDMGLFCSSKRRISNVPSTKRLNGIKDTNNIIYLDSHFHFDRWMWVISSQLKVVVLEAIDILNFANNL